MNMDKCFLSREEDGLKGPSRTTVGAFAALYPTGVFRGPTFAMSGGLKAAEQASRPSPRWKVRRQRPARVAMKMKAQGASPAWRRGARKTGQRADGRER